MFEFIQSKTKKLFDSCTLTTKTTFFNYSPYQSLNQTVLSDRMLLDIR